MGNTKHTVSPRWYAGGCHCGTVRFRVRLATTSAIECNCSICAAKGFIGLIVSKENFEVLEGEEHLRTYQFNTATARHRFCKTCGIHPFSHPRSHPQGYDVNARCLDEGFDWLTTQPFDGQNWEDNVSSIT